MASLQLCDGYLIFNTSVSPRFISQRISHRLIPKASASPPSPSSSSSSSSSFLSLSRRELFYQSAAVSLSLSSIVGPAKADDQLSEWERVYLPIDPGVVLLDIAFVPEEPSRGFLLGTRQTLLETKDSGNTWNPRSIPSAEEEDFNYRFNSISFKGKEGWIIGKPAILLYTADAGENWDRIPLSSQLPGDMVYIKATGDKSAEMVTDEGAIYVTSNKGYNWMLLQDFTPNLRDTFDFFTISDKREREKGIERERMEARSATKLQCQRIGCNAMFTDEDNTEGSCQFHASGPFFHDGMKEWSCCKQRSHDFSLFLEIPGCKTGKHTTEKPVLAKPAPKRPVASPTSLPAANAAAKDSCSRCRQGFFCSDHGSQPKEQIRQTTPVQTEEEKIESLAPPVKKVVININQPQVCKNKGCGKTFKEIDNHETACSYHPGPPVFHDRVKGWKCCDVHVNEFDEFMEIPPCTKGWHSSSPDQAV